MAPVFTSQSFPLSHFFWRPLAQFSPPSTYRLFISINIDSRFSIPTYHIDINSYSRHVDNKSQSKQPNSMTHTYRLNSGRVLLSSRQKPNHLPLQPKRKKKKKNETRTGQTKSYFRRDTPKIREFRRNDNHRPAVENETRARHAAPRSETGIVNPSSRFAEGHRVGDSTLVATGPKRLGP